MSISWIPWVGGAVGVAIAAALLLHIKHQADMVPSLQQQVGQYQSDLKKQVALTTQSEGLRQTEQKKSIQALNDAETSCQARIAEARRSATSIRTITHDVVKYDKNHCPQRVLLDPGKLRDALGAHG